MIKWIITSIVLATALASIGIVVPVLASQKHVNASSEVKSNNKLSADELNRRALKMRLSPQKRKGMSTKKQKGIQKS